MVVFKTKIGILEVKGLTQNKLKRTKIGMWRRLGMKRRVLFIVKRKGFLLDSAINFAFAIGL